MGILLLSEHVHAGIPVVGPAKFDEHSPSLSSRAIFD